MVEVFGWIEVGAQRHPLPAGQTTHLGRSPDVDIVIHDPTVSHTHARIGVHDGVPTLWDHGSQNGTFKDGVAVGDEGTALQHGAVIHLGESEARFVVVGAEQRTRELSTLRRYPLDGDLTVGRAPDNDIVLDEPNVSRRHAVIRSGPPASLEDLGSRNGTRLGADPVRISALTEGDEVGIGHFRLTLERGCVTVADQRVGVGLQGVSLYAKVGDRTILQPTTLTVARGEVLALIGPSGSGKSTLLRLLAGVSKPTSGEATVDGEPIALRLPDLGYVPQEDTIHTRLTVREALACAAVLRLPADTSAAEIAEHVEAVAARLDTMIGSLSGGQRKRVACGVELIGKPSLFLLDEPTSGLDPPLERQMMQTIRDLADEGRGVVVTTHATSSLTLCDTLAIMAPGGHLAYVGPPRKALAHFAVDHYDELYTAAQPTLDLALDVGEADGAPLPRRAARLEQGERPPADRSFGRQVSVLTGRYLRTFVRDRRTMLVLLGQVPLIAVLIAALSGSSLLQHPDAEPVKSGQFVFLLVTASLWIGLISSCREIVNERSIVLREFAVGSRIGAYLTSKTAVLFALAALQTALLLAVATAIVPLHEPASGYVELYWVLLATAWAAIATGLAVSTLARSVDQATSFVPMLLIPQLLFAGALTTVKEMSAPVRLLSDLVVARWAYAGAGSGIEMNARLAGDPPAAAKYGHSFFSLDPVLAIFAVLLFAAAGLAAAGLLLRRRVT
jgi:ABC-type multidrug transport system ATPase subunit/pSer/pThr/pTyr-binding forkhead associated (FHA) protein/ABC-type multidrug transport system permease subunit